MEENFGTAEVWLTTVTVESRGCRKQYTDGYTDGRSSTLWRVCCYRTYLRRHRKVPGLFISYWVFGPMSAWMELTTSNERKYAISTSKQRQNHPGLDVWLKMKKLRVKLCWNISIWILHVHSVKSIVSVLRHRWGLWIRFWLWLRFRQRTSRIERHHYISDILEK